MAVRALGTVLVLACPCVFALNPALDVSQYSHTTWKIRDGFAKGVIGSIAQTPDGYLWLGTEFGLLRFDGIRTVSWQPPRDQQLPSDWVTSLLAGRDGTLWIGTRKGLASLKGSRLRLYPGVGGEAIFRLLEDRQGSVWAGGFAVPTARLCQIVDGRAQCYGGDGRLGTAVVGLHEDRDGNIWVGVAGGMWRWKPDPPEFYPLSGEPNGIRGWAEDQDGTLLFAMTGGIRRLVGERTEMAYPYPRLARRFEGEALHRDRDGGLWIGTMGQGLVHVHERSTDVFAQSDGLSGNDVYALFEDIEGNIWVATSDGLDRFRDRAVATLSPAQGLSSGRVTSVLASRDGSVWIGTGDGLNRWNRGQVTAYRARSASVHPGVHEVVGTGLPERGVQSIAQDSSGRIWVSTRQGVGYLDGNRLVPDRSVPNPNLGVIAGYVPGELWIFNANLGLLHLPGRGPVQDASWATLGHKDIATALTADPAEGGIWLGFLLGGIAYFRDGQVRVSYAGSDGLGRGRVSHLRFDRDGALWAATEGGLSRVQNGRIATLTTKNGLPCDAVLWDLEDDDRSLWLSMACGLVRIPRVEMDAWATDAQHQKESNRLLQLTVFDSSDGVRSRHEGSAYTPQASKSLDGKLWFMNLDGAGVIDPRHIPFNKLPPPVHIEQIIADHKVYSGAAAPKLPPLTRDLEIDYTALSLAAPERDRFRYKLDGYDRDWQDAGRRRQAFYNNLAPRKYRFQVIASNNSGVWNETGDTLEFSIAPTFYQTYWFLAACVVAVLAIFSGLYRLRLYQIAREFNAQLEGRIDERLRVARELHDTLLQSFLGVLPRLQAVQKLLPGRGLEAKEILNTTIDDAAQAITEARDAVQNLRSSTVITDDLAKAVQTLGEDLAAHQTASNGNAPTFSVAVEGASQGMHPILRDEIYRMTAEAMRNAFNHARARRIEVEIRYSPRDFCVRVRDDGAGMDASVLGQESREGHFGLAGMRERARGIGGKLEVWSERGAGTEVELTLPASVAYGHKPGPR